MQTIFLTDRLLILIIVIVSIILLFQILLFNKKKQNSQKDNSDDNNSINSTTMRKNNKLASLTSVLSVSAILLSIVSIVIYFFVIKKFTETATITTAEVAMSLVAVCATLIVGVQIFNSVEYRHVVDKLEKKHDDAIDKLKKEHDDSINNFEKKHADAVGHINSLYKENKQIVTDLERSNIKLIRSDGDASRMVAFLLLSIDKSTWAIGWICRAMKRYSECSEKNKNHNALSLSHAELTDQCIPIIEHCIYKFVEMVIVLKKTPMGSTKKAITTEEAIIKIANQDNPEKKNLIVSRALKDLVDYRIMNGENPIFEETLEQKKLISAYISLTQKVLGEGSLDECKKKSYYKAKEERFVKEWSKYKRDDNIDDLFKELQNMC